MKKNDFRVGDDVSVVITGKIERIACGGAVTVDNKSGLMLCDNEFVFHGHIDGKRHEVKPVRKVKIWVNLYANCNGEIRAGFKYRNEKDCIDSAGDTLDAKLVLTAVEIEVDE